MGDMMKVVVCTKLSCSRGERSAESCNQSPKIGGAISNGATPLNVELLLDSHANQYSVVVGIRSE